jgi:cytochrome c oxidase assembly protein subunit 15
MVCLAVVYLWRVVDGPRAAGFAAPAALRILVLIMSTALTVTILVGVLTTGSGPHAGDHGAARNGLDPELMQHLHSWPAYVSLGGTAAILVWALVLRSTRIARWAGVLLLVEGVQIMVGITQARIGLPPLLVGIHMVLAVVAAGSLTAVVLSLRPRAVASVTLEQRPEVRTA